jgi:hypothetical protein
MGVFLPFPVRGLTVRPAHGSQRTAERICLPTCLPGGIRMCYRGNKSGE